MMREPDGEQIDLCGCCALKQMNDDESACRGFYEHGHAPVDLPIGTAIVDGPFTWNESHRSLYCDGHAGDDGQPAEIAYGQEYWHALKP